MKKTKSKIIGLKDVKKFLNKKESDKLKNISDFNLKQDYIFKIMFDKLTEFHEINKQLKVKFKKYDINFLAWFKKIIDNMAESIWIWDKFERTIYANPNFRKMVKWKLKDMIWEKSYVFWDEESIKTVKNNNKLRKKNRKTTYYWYIKDSNWDLTPVRLTWIPFVNWWTVWIMTDLREIDKIKKEKEFYENIDKIKNEFLSIASHEIKSPLTTIKYYLSTLIEWYYWKLNIKTLDIIHRVSQVNERIIFLINDLLDIQNIESWKIELNKSQVWVNALLNEIFDEYSVIWRQHSIKLMLEIKNNKDLSVFSDKNKLRQVIVNLISNAFKFTEEWWIVKLKCRLEWWERLIFEVSDTWIWIHKKDFDKIFEKFWRVHLWDTKIQKSTWLWLPICRDMVKILWGNLTLKSKIWVWSTFRFMLKLK